MFMLAGDEVPPGGECKVERRIGEKDGRNDLITERDG